MIKSSFTLPAPAAMALLPILRRLEEKDYFNQLTISRESEEVPIIALPKAKQIQMDPYIGEKEFSPYVKSCIRRGIYLLGKESFGAV